MAEYLIIYRDDDGDDLWREVAAKNMKEAARTLSTFSAMKDVDDGFTAKIWRVTGPPKTITMNVETTVSVEIV